MVNNILTILGSLLLLNFIGYFFVVIKEKFYLRNHIILIDHRGVEPEILEHIDVKHFMLGSTEIMAGDEVKIHMDNATSIKGIVLGIIKSENSIALATSAKGITNLKISSIVGLKVVSRYGKFFAKF